MIFVIIGYMFCNFSPSPVIAKVILTITVKNNAALHCGMILRLTSVHSHDYC